MIRYNLHYIRGGVQRICVTRKKRRRQRSQNPNKFDFFHIFHKFDFFLIFPPKVPSDNCLVCFYLYTLPNTYYMILVVVYFLLSRWCSSIKNFTYYNHTESVYCAHVYFIYMYMYYTHNINISTGKKLTTNILASIFYIIHTHIITSRIDGVISIHVICHFFS